MHPFKTAKPLLLTVFVFLFCMCYTVLPVSGRSEKDSALQAFDHLTAGYQKGRIPDTGYLKGAYDGVQNMMALNIAMEQAELLKILEPFRQLAWSSPRYNQYKRLYYSLLSNYAQMSSRYGEMLYYAEKIAQIEEAIRKRPSLSALTVIADYYISNQAYAKVVELYNQRKKYLQDIPAVAQQEKMTPTDLVQTVMLLEKCSKSFFELHDITHGEEVVSLMQRIVTLIKTKYETDNVILSNLSFMQAMAAYNKGKAKSDAAMQQDAIGQLGRLSADTSTPEYLKYYLQVAWAEWETAYYLNYYNADSARHYMNRYEVLTSEDHSPYNHYLALKWKAEYLYQEGRYQESAELLRSAIDTLELARTTTVQDKDNIQYAQAKAEDQQVLLKEAERKDRQKERTIRLVVAGALLLLLIGIFLVIYIRQRQHAKFLEFKLAMARNIHDETGPALLYAKKLTRSMNGGNEAEKDQLQVHLEHSIEVIRSLSHDLKTEEHYTVESLVVATKETLKKLNPDNEFAVHIHDKTGKPRFLSHFQYMHLKAILQECITNTIKHAAFDRIDIVFSRNGNKLEIEYRDNGKGWPTDISVKGIGINNIEERAGKLNGDLSIRNNYPDGYSLGLALLLQ